MSTPNLPKAKSSRSNISSSNISNNNNNKLFFIPEFQEKRIYKLSFKVHEICNRKAIGAILFWLYSLKLPKISESNIDSKGKEIKDQIGDGKEKVYVVGID